MNTTDEAQVSGVLVEFFDRAATVIGQALFADWQGKPLPAVGDAFGCQASQPGCANSSNLRGQVVSRHFEVQRDEAGDSSVWVRLVICTERKPHASRRRRRPLVAFSAN